MRFLEMFESVDDGHRNIFQIGSSPNQVEDVAVSPWQCLAKQQVFNLACENKNIYIYMYIYIYIYMLWPAYRGRKSGSRPEGSRVTA